MKEVKMGGGHYVCTKCGRTAFGSKVHICMVDMNKEEKEGIPQADPDAGLG